MTLTKYREILRLSSLGLSQQNIADSCNVSKKTVNRVLRRAKELDISWLLDESDTDAVLAEKFFPSANQVTSHKKMPDYAYEDLFYLMMSFFLFNFHSLQKPFYLLKGNFFYFIWCSWPLELHIIQQIFRCKDKSIPVVSQNFNRISFPITKDKNIVSIIRIQLKLKSD